ncbi:MAG TPA: hypothetical protein DCX53_03835 [Anaerolineae bacterium]|nr:hypothetical protein [Anaerolineae bacterium]
MCDRSLIYPSVSGWISKMEQSQLQILLIEDDPDDVLLFRESLAEARTVTSKLELAGTLSEGLRRILNQPFDVVLLDLNLPDSRGLDTLRSLLHQATIIPVIVLSGLADDQTTIEAIRQGAQDYLVKGEVTSQILGRVLQYAIERKRNEKQMQIMLEAMPDGVVVVDSAWNINIVNSQTEVVFGYRREDLLGKPIENLISEFKSIVSLGHRDQDLAAPAIRTIGLGLDLYAQRKDGSLFPVDISMSAIETDQGQMAISVIRDITDQRKAEEEIHRHLKRLEALHAIDEAIAGSMDQNHVFKTILEQGLPQLNADAAILLLYDKNSQILNFAAGHGFRTQASQYTSLSLGEGYAGRVAALRQMAYIPNIQVSETGFLRASKFVPEEFVSYYCIPLIAKDEILGVMEVYYRKPFEADEGWLNFFNALGKQAAIAIDNSNLFKELQLSNIDLENRVKERTAELNRLNLELEHANRAKDEFLATMSHELRTPLNSILGFSEYLLEQRRGPLNEKQEQYIQMISSSGSHLLVLINDILDVSKIEAGKLNIHPEIISVTEICESSLNFIKTEAIKKSISVEFINDTSTTTMRADPQRLKQILVNLLNNAVKFTPEKGRVSLEVKISAEREQILFSVSDTGIGIKQNDLNKLFSPFTQVDNSLSRRQEGTGLGLVIVYKLTELHGGSIQVESEFGKGSRFNVVLPWKLDESLSPENKPNSPDLIDIRNRAQSPKRDLILLAEDIESNVMTIQAYLSDYGYEVIDVPDGLEAIARAKEILPALILMDIQMPKMNGLEAIRQLRADSRFDSTPIIALTALAMPGDRERCIEAGANEYMSKPVSLKALVRTIDKLLAK